MNGGRWCARSLAVLSLVASAARAQVAPSDSLAIINGQVLDAARAPVANATVEVLGINRSQTDTAGRFQFPAMPGGQYILRITKIGYRQSLKAITIVDGETFRMSVTLELGAQELGPVIVNADSAFTQLNDVTGFERRRRGGGSATFITEDEIAKKHIFDTEQLFHGLPAVMVDTGGIIVIKRGEISLRDLNNKVNQFYSCVGAQVIVDGVLMPQPFNINEIAIGAIHGIEIYRGPATTPSALRSAKTVCGTVAIWTK